MWPISETNEVAEQFFWLWEENRVQPRQGRMRVAEVSLISEAANEHQCPALRPGAGFSKTVSATLKGPQTEKKCAEVTASELTPLNATSL